MSNNYLQLILQVNTINYYSSWYLSRSIKRIVGQQCYLYTFFYKLFAITIATMLCF